MIKSLIIASLLSFSFLLFPMKIGIRSSIRPDSISVNDVFTNSIYINISPEKKGRYLSAGTFVCEFPGDPSVKGLKTVRSGLRERTETEKGQIVRRLYRIDYIFSPEYAGTIVLKPLPIHFILNGVTNTVLSPKKSIPVRSENSQTAFWIILTLCFILGTGGLVLYLIRRNAKTNTTDTDITGGDHGD